MPQIFLPNNSTAEITAPIVDSANPEPGDFLVNSPLCPRQNQDSLWFARRDSLLKLTFPSAKKFKEYSVSFRESEPTLFVRGEFSEHLLKVSEPIPRLKPPLRQDFSTIVVFSLLFIFGVLSMVYRKRVQILFSAFLLRRYANQIQREENALSQRVSVLLTVTFLISMTLLVQKIIGLKGINPPSESPALSFLILLGFVLVYFFSKILLHRIAAFFLRLEREVNDYLFNMFLVHQIGGLALFTVTMVSGYIRFYDPGWVVQATLIIFGLMFFFQTIRGIAAVRFEGLNTFFYIFLYFCTLEVLPIAILFKMVQV